LFWMPRKAGDSMAHEVFAEAPRSAHNELRGLSR
jgi:hypothetical protein